MDLLHWGLIILVAALVWSKKEDLQACYEEGYRIGYGEGRAYEHGRNREYFYKKGYEAAELKERKQDSNNQNESLPHTEVVNTKTDCCDEEIESY